MCQVQFLPESPKLFIYVHIYCTCEPGQSGFETLIKLALARLQSRKLELTGHETNMLGEAMQ